MECLHSGSQIVVSHISHSGKLLHEELVAACRDKNITVAYDGLIVNVA